MSSGTEIFSRIPKTGHHEEMLPVNHQEFMNIVLNRRSIRVYTEEKIPDEIVQKCLDIALLAPNSSNLQPWEFYWVQTPAKLKKLQAFCMGQPAAKTSQTLIVAVARSKSWNQARKKMVQVFDQNKDKVHIPKSAYAYYEKLAPLLYGQGFLNLKGLAKRIIFNLVGIFKVVPRGPFSSSDMKLWATKSTSLACQNLMMAFSSFGYDTCPMEGFDEKRVKGLLNLPCDASVVMVVSAGKRAHNGLYGPRIRFDNSDFIKKV